MSQITLENSAKNINFAHLYFGYTQLNSLQKCTSYFKNFYPIDMTHLPSKLPETNILFIEVDAITKEKFIIINSIVKQYSSKCIYIVSKTPENSFLLKFALHFSLNKILLLKDDESFLKKSLLEAVKKFIHKQSEQQQIEISKRLNNFFALLAFKHNELIFANEKAFDVFDANDLKTLEAIIKNEESIHSLLLCNSNENRVIVMENSLGEDWKYNFFLNPSANGIDKLLSVIPHRKIEEDEVSFSTLNRFKFIEYLKDKLAQSHVNLNDISLLLINISNYDKITKAAGSIKVHDFIKKFIMQILRYKEPDQELTQWNPHFFILLIENENFSEAKERLDSLHQKLIYSEIDEEINAIVKSSVLDIQSNDINSTIAHVENISNGTINLQEFNDNEYFEINHLNDYLSEDEQIHHHLYSCIANKTNLKLLNIYKGLCINTKSNVVKHDGDEYFLSFEILQGYSMQIEGKTVIQSPDFPYDISADVSYINFDKSIVILDNFEFLTFSANNRQHTRVQPNIRTPLMVKYKKFGYQGEILDMSINAIAVKFSKK